MYVCVTNSLVDHGGPGVGEVGLAVGVRRELNVDEDAVHHREHRLEGVFHQRLLAYRLREHGGREKEIALGSRSALRAIIGSGLESGSG